nr:hypothetical protein GCM10020092_037650 [Actinoplanes digitatis]
MHGVDLLVRRGQRHIGDLLAIDLRDGRQGRVGERRTEHTHHAVVGELVEREHRLIRRALVVPHGQLDRASEQAALVVDLLDRQLDGLAVLAAQRRVVPGERGDQADFDRAAVAVARGIAAAPGGGQRRHQADEDKGWTSHEYLQARAAH